MKILALPRSRLTWALGFWIVLSTGCVGPGYGYDDGVGISTGYYEPYGYDYGGWGAGYGVGPYRGGDHRRDGGGGNRSGHAYAAAPASHSMPSIPSRGRSGGGRR